MAGCSRNGSRSLLNAHWCQATTGSVRVSQLEGAMICYLSLLWNTRHSTKLLHSVATKLPSECCALLNFMLSSCLPERNNNKKVISLQNFSCAQGNYLNWQMSLAMLTCPWWLSQTFSKVWFYYCVAINQRNLYILYNCSIMGKVSLKFTRCGMNIYIKLSR